LKGPFVDWNLVVDENSFPSPNFFFPVPSQILFRQQELKLKYPIKPGLDESLDFKNLNIENFNNENLNNRYYACLNNKNFNNTIQDNRRLNTGSLAKTLAIET